MTAGRDRWRLPPPVRGMRAAFVFLSRLPLGGFPYRDEDFAWAPAHAPLVGLVVGALGASAFVLVRDAGAWVAALVGLAVTMFATGGFHEDGLADTADALGGAIFDRRRVLEILKDSRVGTFGALALIVSVSLRVALLVSYAVRSSGDGVSLAQAGIFAFVTTHVAARVTPTWMMASMPYVTDPEHAKSRPVVRAGPWQAVVCTCEAAALLVAAITWFPTPVAGAVGIGAIAVVLASAVCAFRFLRRVGGITGDFLGATEQVSEVAFLLALTCTM
ncbi:MAG: adenosylcobinamide-GDP ribazoletransferase [Myxococcota bacterium]